MSKKIILDDKYEVVGLAGAWCTSKEDRHVEVGDVRYIGRKLMYAYTVEYKMMYFKVNWSAVENSTDYEEIRKWIASL